MGFLVNIVRDSRPRSGGPRVIGVAGVRAPRQSAGAGAGGAEPAATPAKPPRERPATTDATAAPAVTSEPPADASAPPAEASAQPVETSAPPTEASAPSVETAVPPTQTSAPPADTPAPQTPSPGLGPDAPVATPPAWHDATTDGATPGGDDVEPPDARGPRPAASRTPVSDTRSEPVVRPKKTEPEGPDVGERQAARAPRSQAADRPQASTPMMKTEGAPPTAAAARPPQPERPAPSVSPPPPPPAATATASGARARPPQPGAGLPVAERRPMPVAPAPEKPHRPEVRIGHLDVIVVEPESRKKPTRAAGPAADHATLASRRYLRSL